MPEMGGPLETADPAAPPQTLRRPHTATDIYRPQAIAFQRFRMIGRPDPRAPRLLGVTLAGAFAIGAVALALAQLTYREHVEATVVSASAEHASLRLAADGPELRLPARSFEVRTQAGTHLRLRDPALLAGKDGRELRGRIERLSPTGRTVESAVLTPAMRVTVTGGTYPIWK